MLEDKRKDLVEKLKRKDYLEKPETIEAFETVPREEFIPSKYEKQAYVDRPLSIGEGQTISAPSMIAIMLEVLKVEEGQKILEIGTGSGYNAALMAEMVGEDGKIFSVERLTDIAEFGRRNLEDAGYGDLVEVLVGDGTTGLEEEAPYDRIIVTACSPKVSDDLIEQLKVGGILAAPVGSHYRGQRLLEVQKESEDETDVNRHTSCAFVPLIGEDGWDEGEVR